MKEATPPGVTVVDGRRPSLMGLPESTVTGNRETNRVERRPGTVGRVG